MRYKDHTITFSAAITLTFIGSSIATLVYWFSALFYNSAKELITNITNATSMDNTSSLFFLSLGTLYFISFIGALKMWKKQKAGFFFYSMAQIVILFLPLMWLGGNSFSTTNTIYTILFIGIYSLNLKHFN